MKLIGIGLLALILIPACMVRGAIDGFWLALYNLRNLRR